MLAVPNPILPQITPNRPTIPVGGTEITVGSGKDYAATQAGLQAAMDAANRGDIITIDAGSVITIGSTPLIMKRKSGSGYVWVRSSGYSSFTDHIRAGSGDTAAMAKLVKSGTTGRLLCIEFIKTAGQMSHTWAWEGIEFTGSHTSGTLAVMISFLRDNTLGQCDDQSYEPHDFHLLHCYVHGDDTHNYRVGVEPGCLRAGIWDSTITEIHEAGADSQAINCPSGTGGIIVYNCKLQASGEVIMWGGSYQQMTNINMADFTVRRCDLSWDPAWKGGSFTLKNLFEIKHGERHLLEDCTIHDCWAAGQAGQAIVLKENAEGDSWNRVKDITVRRCKVYNAQGIGSLLTVQGSGAADHTGMSDIVFRHNVGWNLNGVEGGSSAYQGNFEVSESSAQPGQRLVRVGLYNNTILHDDFGGSSGTGAAAIRWVNGNDGAGENFEHWYVRDNVMSLWGAADSIKYGFSSADPTLSQAHNQGAIEFSTPRHGFTGNLFIGDYIEGRFPSGNTKAADYAAAAFEDFAGGDLRLASGSPGKGKGRFGRDPGANIPGVDAATAGCLSGDWVN